MPEHSRESRTRETDGATVAVDTATVGYRAPQVCSLVGITYRQLDYWARTGLITPTVQAATGSGSQRQYSFTDIVQLKVVKRLLDAGMSLKRIRTAMDILRDQLDSDTPLTDVTLLSDGSTIYAAHSADEVVDVFRRGQGVFGIAVGPVQQELEGEIHRLFPGEATGAGDKSVPAEGVAAEDGSQQEAHAN